MPAGRAPRDRREENGWYKISGGYISADYAEKRFCMNEANKLDMKAMVLNFYDRPGVSNVSNYLNIRAGAGKMRRSSENSRAMRMRDPGGCERLVQDQFGRDHRICKERLYPHRRRGKAGGDEPR